MAMQMAEVVATVPGQVVATLLPSSVEGKGLTALGNITGMPAGAGGGLFVRQQWSALEAVTGGAYEKANVYDIYSSDSWKKEDQLLRVHAKSTTCERTCCAPNHSLMLEVNDLSGNTLITIQRPGWATGKYCLGGCPAATDCCQDGVIIHEGKVTAKATMCDLGVCCCDGCGQEVENPNPISKAQVPACGGGGCTPTVAVFEDHDSAEPNGHLTGPCFFGGCTELCCESEFKYRALDGREIGRVRKLVPTSCGQVCQEICTDSDRYKFDFYQGSSGEEKANTIALGLLSDYMFFERDMGMITCVPNEQGKYSLRCTCCLMSCFGCICPFYCNLDQSSADAGGAPTAPDAQEQTEARAQVELRRRNANVDANTMDRD